MQCCFNLIAFVYYVCGLLGLLMVSGEVVLRVLFLLALHELLCVWLIFIRYCFRFDCCCWLCCLLLVLRSFSCWSRNELVYLRLIVYAFVCFALRFTGLILRFDGVFCLLAFGGLGWFGLLLCLIWVCVIIVVYVTFRFLVLMCCLVMDCFCLVYNLRLILV